MQSFNPSSPVAGQPADGLSRVPKAPRTPSRAARLLVVNFGAPGVALALFGGILALMGTLMALGLSAQATGHAILLFPLVFPIVGCVMILVSIVGYRRRRRAFTQGTPVLGWIVSFGPDARARGKGRSPTVLAWAFEAPGGRFTGSVSSFNAELFGEQRVGAPVIVLFDPKNPAVSTLWVE